MRCFTVLLTALFLMFLAGCFKPGTRTVVVYASVDQTFSEPVLQQFQRETGIKVLPIFDVEAAKTTGLANRLVAESGNPRADVFWSGEFIQTIMLRGKGILCVYKSPNATGIPSRYTDRDGYWAGLAGRARVLLVNTNLLTGTPPASIMDLLDPKWPADKIGLANPLFGTTLTHASALYAELGPAKARDFFSNLQARGIRIVAGNSTVRDMVASGQLIMGLTDTDDAASAIERGAPVKAVFLDQQGMGTLVIPGTVAMIESAPHPVEARKLIDFLLSRQVSERLVQSGWCHVPLASSSIKAPHIDTSGLKAMNIQPQAIADQLETVRKELKDIFLR